MQNQRCRLGTWTSYKKEKIRARGKEFLDNFEESGGGNSKYNRERRGYSFPSYRDIPTLAV